MRRPRVALLYPGGRALRERADRDERRFADLFDALEHVGVDAEPAVYHDDFADDVVRQLERVDAVLVWCNPIEGGRRRERLDSILHDVSRQGVFVSTHPDTIVRLGTKDVLVATRDLPFGSDVVRVDSLDQLARELPGRLETGPRVLKQHRGQSGVGVWRVEAPPGSTRLRVRHAQRGSEDELLDLAALLERLATYFEPANGGHMVDQAWQPRIADGTVRAYLVEGRVAGFGHQAVNALCKTEFGQPVPQSTTRVYCGPDEPACLALKSRLENGWIEQLRERTGVSEPMLPMLWDCDFMLGGPSNDEGESFVLCEINVSSVSPYPPSVNEALAYALKRRLDAKPNPGESS